MQEGSRSREGAIPAPLWRSEWRLILVLATVILAAIVVGAILAYIENRPRVAHILAVTASPDRPTSSDIITVTAEVDTAGTDWRPDVVLEYQAYFGGYDRGGGAMRFLGGSRYAIDIGPFPDRTEVWLAVAAFLLQTQVDVNADRIVQVGTVLRDGSSGLRIGNPSHSPSQPRAGDTISLTAAVTTNSTLVGAFLVYVYAHSPAFGIANQTMIEETPGSFVAIIYNPFLFGYIFEPGAVLRYRVVAIDMTWNTADSGVLSLTVADGQTQP